MLFAGGAGGLLDWRTRTRKRRLIIRFGNPQASRAHLMWSSAWTGKREVEKEEPFVLKSPRRVERRRSAERRELQLSVKVRRTRGRNKR